MNLTDTDSCSLLSNFVSYDSCATKESKARSLLFEILANSKIAKRLDTSHKIWKKYGSFKHKLYKQTGLYEIKSIDNPSLVTISVNPK